MNRSVANVACALAVRGTGLLMITTGAAQALLDRQLRGAIIHYRSDVVQAQLPEEKKVKAVFEDRQTPLMLAVALGCKRTVQLLLNHGVALDTRDKFGATAPMKSALRVQSTICTPAHRRW